MKVLFDNCTSPVMARTLHGFVSGEGDEAIHIRELPLDHPSDLEWMNYIRHEGSDWLVVTGDHRLSRNKAERIAFQRARLKGVVLANAYQKSPMSRRCAALIAQWPRLIETMAQLEPPVLLEISINLSGRFKPIM